MKAATTLMTMLKAGDRAMAQDRPGGGARTT